jgi:hypothetical protein
VEIEGKPIVSFEAVSAHEAAELLKEDWFRDELQSLTSSGAPLWDGVAGMRSRPASESEIDRYRSMIDSAADESGDLFLAFAVTLDSAGSAQSSARRERM